MLEFKRMPELREERRLVTVLYADVVGSTTLAERLGAEDARLIIGEAIARAVRIVQAYGGTVKDLAGDGVLALFGAPIAHEDDPERAIRAGLEIAATVTAYAEEVRRGWGFEGFGVRVGADTGEVVVGQIGAGSRTEYGATGSAVNVASRLQGAAEPGTVLAGERTRALAGERFAWRDPIRLNLKGSSEPVMASTAVSVREKAADEVVGPPLTGRDSELATLREVVDAMQAGRGGIVFLGGEPGIGKSRLATELRLATRDSVDWLEGRAVSYGTSLAWWPVRDLLRGWIGMGTGEPELRVRLALRRRLEELFPVQAQDLQPYLAGVLGLAPDNDMAPALAGLSPEAVQYRTYEVLHDLVTALAANRPLVISIDDLHWADPTTLGLLDRLLPLAERAPVVFVFTMRPETEHGSWTLRERATREFRHLVTVIDLKPLDESAERVLLKVLTEDAIEPAVQEAVIAHADGNPLYLEELARAIGEGGRPTAQALSLPPTLEGVILARLDRLEAGWRSVLTAAAACGRRFSFGLLQAVARVDEAHLREALHHLQRLDLLQEERRWPEASYRFKHALIQEAAYRTLLNTRRRDLHASAAKWLQARYAESPERVYGLIAHHWLSAEDDQEAARYLQLAGEQALREWALDEAVDHYRSLLPLLERLGQEEQSTELLFRLASTLHLALRNREAAEVWREAFARWRYPVPTKHDATATFRIAANQVPWSTDPSTGLYATNQGLFQQLWDRLVEGRPGPYVVPGLASSWEVSDDGLVYRLHLREGVTWNDGQTLGADDVVRAYRRIVDPDHLSLNATMMFVVENGEARSRGEVTQEQVGVRALDQRTVEFRLNTPYPAFLFYLVYPEFSANRPDLSNGPFRVVAMEDKRVALDRDPRYPRRRGGNVARIEWVLAEDPDQLAQLARAGDVDAIWGHTQLAGAASDAGLVRLDTPRVQTGFIAFGGSGAFASDQQLRRSLALATDRAALAAALPVYQGIATGGLVPPGILGHTPGIALGYSPTDARKALQTSAFAGPLTLAVATEHSHPSIDLLAGMWRQNLSIDVRVIWTPMSQNRDWPSQSHVQFWQWVAHAPDAEYFLRNLLHGQSLTKLGVWTSPSLDSLLDRARQTSDGAVRLDLYHQADRLAVQEECLVIPVMYAGIRWLVKPWVHGVWQWGSPWQSWDEVTIDDSSPRYRD
ncbi:MAG TPA: ABC transporter substrate-binding protein [Candidatus Dormibacteraeota bacterium]|nr:ABC transporter substrate-binding protein [Candidatus Dormibacteraeota bacterium]